MCFKSGDGHQSVTKQILPDTVKPSHYSVALTPDLTSFVFTGSVSVLLAVKRHTKTIVANVNEVSVTSCHIIVKHLKTETKLEAAITYQPKVETVTFEFTQEIPAGSTVTLLAEFNGVHNDKMAGFYRSGYTDPQGSKQFLVVTQCEATDCRRIFPCWDEPNLKSTFDVTLIVDPSLVALSNMNILREVPVTINGTNFKQVTFACTPVMSPYLFALAVGDFDYVEAVARPQKPEGAMPITCRTYTLKGQSEQGRFALGVSTKCLEFYSEYFGMDMIAVPDFGAGAMENWGLVTYREVLLLFDEKKTSAETKKKMAYVIAHELAHQWFDWWNELWLNEGFATFVGWLATDHIFPDWKVWTSFLTDDFSQGLSLDAMRSSHPIDIDVNKPSEINQIFDAISYSKGASLIRMLNAYLGADAFKNGVSAYLKQHAYGNAKTTDLWNALEKTSGKDVEGLMQAWTREVGYPMVTVHSEILNAAKNEMTLNVSQQRFLSSGDLTAEEVANDSTWFIPIEITTHLCPKQSISYLLNSKQGTLTFPYDALSTAFYKLNFETTGFYRVCYSQQHLEVIGNAIARDASLFSVQDRIGILMDAFAFARAGYGSTIGALNLVKGFVAEENFMVLDQIATCLKLVSTSWYKETNVVKGVHALQRSIFSSKVKTLGYIYTAGEDFLVSQKRTLVITEAANAGDTSVIEELQCQFANYIAGDESAINANLRSIVFSITLEYSNNPKADFDAVKKVYMTADNPDAKLAALGSLGATNSIELIHELLKMSMDHDIVKQQDVIRPIGSLGALNPHKVEVLDILWKWCILNWAVLHEQLAVSLSLLGRVLQTCVASRIEPEFAQEVEAWSRGDDCATPEEVALRTEQLLAVKRPLEQGLERVRGIGAWVSRENTQVLGWAKAIIAQ